MLSELLSFLLGSIAAPLLLFFISKITPDKVALVFINFLERLFANQDLRNKISNAIGIRFIFLGVSLITAIKDQQIVEEKIENILQAASDLLFIFSKEEKEG